MVGSPDHSCTPERTRERSLLRSRRCSPPQWMGQCSRSECRKSEVAIERIVEQDTPVGNFLVLTKINYYDWAALMHVMSRQGACGLR
jgi:hypothetical protein